MTNRPKPHVHGRDHEHGGADTTHVHYEKVGTTGGGGGGGGLQFDTEQTGQWLYFETDGTASSPSGFGVEIYDASGNGIDLASHAGGQILLQTVGHGDILVQSTGNIRLLPSFHLIVSLPTSDPGVPNALWNDGGTVKVST